MEQTSAYRASPDGHGVVVKHRRVFLLLQFRRSFLTEFLDIALDSLCGLDAVPPESSRCVDDDDLAWCRSRHRDLSLRES